MQPRARRRQRNLQRSRSRQARWNCDIASSRQSVRRAWRRRKGAARNRIDDGTDAIELGPGVHDQYSAILLGGWVGKIKRIGWLTPIGYTIHWTKPTLDQAHPVFFKRCHRDEVKPYKCWLDEDQLEEAAEPTPVATEPTTNIVTRPLSTDDPDDRIRKVETWASGVVRTIGWANFLHDPSQTPHLKLYSIDEAFGITESTGAAKLKTIRTMFKIRQFDHKWTLPSKMDNNPMVWMLEVNGFLLDIRNAPQELQEVAFQKGLIPYIPADRAEPDKET